MKYLPVALPLMAACSRDQPRHASHDTGQVPACAAGELLDDAQQCVPEACGSTHWGDIEDASFYVDASAGEGGTGSIDAPFSTIAAAIEAAHAAGGGRIAIAAGTYLENLVLDSHADDAELIGRCPDLVVLDGSNGSSDQPTVERAGSSSVSATLARMTITGGPEGGLLISRGDVLGQELRVVDNAGVGALVYSKGVLTLEDSLVAGTTEGSAQGRGLDIEHGGVATLRNAVVEGNEGEGIYTSQADAAVYLYDSSVLDNGGRGVNAQSGALFHAENSVIRGNSDVGIVAFDKGTSVTLIDTEVSSTAEAGAGREGRGVSVVDGAVLTATGCSVLANRNVGVNVSGTYDDGTPAQATLNDCTISGTRSSDPGGMGRGVNVQQGAQVELNNCTVTDNQQDGVYAASEGTVVTLNSTTISDTDSLDDGLDGYGLAVEDGAVVVATECTISQNHELGILIVGPSSIVTLSNSSVSDTLPTVYGTGGVGIAVQNDGALVVSDTSISSNRVTGLLVIENSRVELTQTTIEGTIGNFAMELGRGLSVESGSSAEVFDSIIQDNHDVGVFATGDGTFVNINGSTVASTRPSSNTSVACGLLTQSSAEIAADMVTVSSNSGPGLYSVSGGDLSCASCTIEGNAFAGALAIDGGTLRLDESSIEGTTASENTAFGVGLAGVGIANGTTLAPPTISARATTVSNPPHAGVWIEGPGSYMFDDCDFEGGLGSEPWEGAWWHGDAFFARSASTNGDSLVVSNTLFRDSRHGVFLEQSSAILKDNSWVRNEIDVWQQGCEDTERLVGSGLGSASNEICPEEVRLAADLDFPSLFFEDSDGYEAQGTAEADRQDEADRQE